MHHPVQTVDCDPEDPSAKSYANVPNQLLRLHHDAVRSAVDAAAAIGILVTVETGPPEQLGMGRFTLNVTARRMRILATPEAQQELDLGGDDGAPT